MASIDIIAFVTIADVERAKKYYRDTLGLRLVSEQLPFALEFDANGVMLRLAIAKQVTPAPGTVLGWGVPNIAAAVKELNQAGIVFARFEGMTAGRAWHLGLAFGGEGGLVQRPGWKFAEPDGVSWREEIKACPGKFSRALVHCDS